MDVPLADGDLPGVGLVGWVEIRLQRHIMWLTRYSVTPVMQYR